MYERHMTTAGRLAAATLLAAFAVACGDDDPTGPDGGFEATYTATVSGDVTATLGGTAVFATGTDPESGQSAWLVYLVTDEGAAFSAGNNVIFAGLGAPQQQSYMLTDMTGSSDLPEGGAGAILIMYDGQTLSGVFSSTGGTLTVTSLSENRMDGTFSLTASGTVFDGETSTEGEVTIQGSFEARTGAFLVPPIG